MKKKTLEFQPVKQLTRLKIAGVKLTVLADELGVSAPLFKWQFRHKLDEDRRREVGDALVRYGRRIAAIGDEYLAG